MPGKQVLQSTFDAIVREAMSDFNLSATEAVADAREQLSKAGVTDFSNLTDPTASASASAAHEGVTIPNKLLAALGHCDPQHELVSLLHHLARASHEVIAVAGSNGAMESVARALALAADCAAQGDWVLAEACFAAVSATCSVNEANRVRLVATRSPDAVAQLKALLESAAAAAEEDLTCIQEGGLFRALWAAQHQCEAVKQRVASGASLDGLIRILDATAVQLRGDGTACAAAAVVSGVCAVLRQILSPDDSTVSVAETFNRAKILAGAGSVSESGLRPLETDVNLLDVLRKIAFSVRDAPEVTYAVRTSVLKDCIALARLSAISDEICSYLMKLDFEALAVELLEEEDLRPGVALSCIALLRNLAGRDECKSALFRRMDAVRSAAERHIEQSSSIAECFCGFVGSLCLRRPDIARRLVSSEVFAIILTAMQKHCGERGVQRMACLAVRNACSRDDEARASLREGKAAETLIRKAWKTFPRDCDEIAYCALRELDVLSDDELRRDTRYTMPAGFFNIKPSKVVQTGIGYREPSGT